MKMRFLVAGSLTLAVGCVPPPKRERVELWAVGAVASSEGIPGNTDFSALQATGMPDVGGCGDDPRAWSPETADAPLDPAGWNEWLELTYPDYVFVHAIRVYETYNPGTIVAIDVEASDQSAPTIRLYSDANGEPGACPSVLATYVDQGTTVDQYNRVVVYLNTNLIGDANANGAPDDYNAIDAVQLVGDRFID